MPPRGIGYQHVTGFAVGGLGGNDAGVVLPRDNEPLNDRERLALAAVVGFPETAFITSLRPTQGGCEISLRYFTPSMEVDLCGHATVACVGLLHERNLLGGWRRGMLHTRAGKVSFIVQCDATGAAPPRVFMQQLAPVIDPPLSAYDVQAVVAALFQSSGAAGGPSSWIDEAWTPRVASTGLRDLLVGLTPGGLEAIDADMGAVAALSRRLGTVGLHAFEPPPHKPPQGFHLQVAEEVHAHNGGAAEPGGSPSSSSAEPSGSPSTMKAAAECYRVRNFAPAFGVVEESATGTSNCALACALWASGEAARGHVLTFAQGEGMGMPSRITVLPPAADEVLACEVLAGDAAAAEQQQLLPQGVGGLADRPASAWVPCTPSQGDPRFASEGGPSSAIAAAGSRAPPNRTPSRIAPALVSPNASMAGNASAAELAASRLRPWVGGEFRFIASRSVALPEMRLPPHDGLALPTAPTPACTQPPPSTAPPTTAPPPSAANGLAQHAPTGGVAKSTSAERLSQSLMLFKERSTQRSAGDVRERPPSATPLSPSAAVEGRPTNREPSGGGTGAIGSRTMRALDFDAAAPASAALLASHVAPVASLHPPGHDGPPPGGSPQSLGTGSWPSSLAESPLSRCSACVGVTRGKYGESFCRRCGRKYVSKHSKHRGSFDAIDPELATLPRRRSWCDTTIGAIAFWLHRHLDIRRFFRRSRRQYIRVPKVGESV